MEHGERQTSVSDWHSAHAGCVFRASEAQQIACSVCCRDQYCTTKKRRRGGKYGVRSPAAARAIFNVA